jgi:hypothetical protein
MKKKYIWTCDYCGEDYDTKHDCDKHELMCKNNPKNKLNIFNLIYPNGDMVWVIASLFVIYFFAFLVCNVNAKSDGLPARNILRPQNWFESNNPQKLITPTLAVNRPTQDTPTPLPSMPPQAKQKAKVAANTDNSSNIDCVGPDGKVFKTSQSECIKFNQAWGKPVDYVVDCSINSNCGGGTKKLMKSICDNSTCCQIGNNWIFYTSKQKCNSDQGSQYKNNYVYPTYTPLATWAPLPTYSYQTYVTPTMTEQQAQAIIDQHNSQVQQCRNNVISNYDQKLRNCNIQFGDSSATDACLSIVGKERQSAYSNCGQIY